MRKPILLVLVLAIAVPAWAQPADREHGKAVWDLWCEPCHAVDPRKHPGTQALRFKYRETDIPAALEERTDLTPELVAFYVRNGVSIMPFFRKMEISDSDLDDLAAWLTDKE